ncbi:YEATS domain-containing protein 4 [Marchantia polymorpha subsp. ruderalis]|uniref:YEATS domain-containing protein n=2 Tax=Marchantia polymorpha TaxID=3197 RepID=A0A176W8K8_MARPO|nr:hypothetical protein AXG93_2090s1130 [Marchantia polymorpha subsp. ruderalis]PTQ28251.1 hypothetical protein MARPO_0169s0015 [Marchantia polymorpha]BBN09378.1 hypothetical protein Mp_4g19290 [Marchantia polymorpha subsp. ruderalis]|eukprot:PTQ28251.1 hypothetical protein MARPO_0169s0015 [Marchantia polymorpha]
MASGSPISTSQLLLHHQPGLSTSSSAAGATASPSPASPTVSSKRKRRLTDLTTDEINEIVALRGKLPQAVVGKKFGIEQTEVSAIQRMQRAKTARLLDDNEKKNPVRRVKDVEMTVPIAYGTVSFWLGKKADEYHSHRWTVYVRSALGEDLGPVIKKVVFQLHPSFNNPTRSVEAAPFELTETGWGEFEIGITVYFHPDASEKPLEIFHHLKLYPEDDSGPQNTKKPVVVESYDEIVFTEPSEAFFSRIQKHPSLFLNGKQNPPSAGTENEKKRGETKEQNITQWFLKHSDSEELEAIISARDNVMTRVNKLKADLLQLENEAARLKANAAH